MGSLHEGDQLARKCADGVIEMRFGGHREPPAITNFYSKAQAQLQLDPWGSASKQTMQTMKRNHPTPIAALSRSSVHFEC